MFHAFSDTIVCIRSNQSHIEISIPSDVLIEWCLVFLCHFDCYFFHHCHRRRSSPQSKFNVIQFHIYPHRIARIFCFFLFTLFSYLCKEFVKTIRVSSWLWFWFCKMIDRDLLQFTSVSNATEWRERVRKRERERKSDKCKPISLPIGFQCI